MAKSSAGVSSLARAVTVLEAFDTGVRDLSATEIAARAHMPLSTAHRIIGELVALGLLERAAERRYRIGLRLWELAVRTPGPLGIRELAMPTLRAVHSAIGQHLQLTILKDDQVLFLERLSAPRSTVNFVVVGSRMPFHSTSSGLVLAAFAEPEVRERLITRELVEYAHAPRPAPAEMREELERVRRQRYAITRGYIDPAATAIAVPVLSPLGFVIAALSAIVPSSDTREAQVLTVLQPAAEAIGQALRRRYGSDGGAR